MKIALHIERLVLDGVPLASGQQALLHAAVVEALTARLGDGVFAARLAAQPRRDVVHGAPIRLSSQTDPQSLGTDIASSIHAGFGGGQ